MSEQKVDINIISDWSFLILNTISAICTIGSTFFIRGQSNSGKIKLLYWCIFFVIISCGYYILKLNKKYKDKTFKISNIFHQMNHNIRDEMFKVSYYYGKKKLTQELLDKSFTIIVRYAVDSLVEMLNTLTNQQIYICMKYFVDQQDNILNSKVRTLVRSSNTPKNRKNNKQAKVSEVTDYINILAGNDYYYNENISTDNEYKNTYICTNIYKTKIVVPISVDIYDDFHAHDIQGFICADCEIPKAFKKNFDICFSFMSGIADDLYGYFSDYQKYTLLIKVKEEVASDEKD